MGIRRMMHGYLKQCHVSLQVREKMWMKGAKSGEVRIESPLPYTGPLFAVPEDNQVEAECQGYFRMNPAGDAPCREVPWRRMRADRGRARYFATDSGWKSPR